MHRAFETHIVVESGEVDAKLAALGLDLPGLVEVVLRGERARAECVPNDPIISPGFDAWRYRVRALRDLYLPLGWDKATVRGLEMIHSVERHLRVITRAGDQGVGIADAFPQPKRELIGPTTAAVIDENATMYLDPNWLNIDDGEPEATYETWMLLVYYCEGVLRAELSLPSSIMDSRVQGWKERIILNLEEPTSQGGTSETPIVVDVPVLRR